jgi:2-polyprenyl-6-methoxyphenol hydroxylase-like FAD-dependent oxidoreductase
MTRLITVVLVRDLRVAVAGAGLGGLCLAQGLVKAGFDVRVYERDAALDIRRQGYRLHVDGRAARSLQACLPPPLYELFLATTGRPTRRINILSKSLRVRRELPGDPSAFSTSVDRGVLREILAAGLEDRIRFDTEVIAYKESAAGIEVGLAHLPLERVDVLIGADGVNSAVRRTLLPEASLIDTGDRIIYGRTALDEETRCLLPPALHDGFAAIVGRRVGVAAGLVEFRTPPPEAGARIGVRLSPAHDYLMWAVSAQRKRFPASDEAMAEMDTAKLHAVAATMVRRWHPDLRALIDRAEIDRTFFIRVRISGPVPAWPPGRVTLLGDAVHAMSPARGSGANLALLDAAHLCAALTGANDVVTAIGGYEKSLPRT